MPDCIFCSIVAGTIPSRSVYEDEQCVAFLDIAPAAPGHTLVIPRAHVADIWAADASTMAGVGRSVQAVAAQIRRTLAPEGLTLIQSTGEAAWQDVFHLHVHLIPRSTGDPLIRPWHGVPADAAELDDVWSTLTASPPT